MIQKLQSPLRIAVVGAAGKVGTHISSLLVNALCLYYQDNGFVNSSALSGRYSRNYIQTEKLNNLFSENIKKFSPVDSHALPIEIDLVLNNSNQPSSSSYLFRNAVGFGFHPAESDEIPGVNSRIEIPKSDLNKLGVRIVENIHECIPGYHLGISVVTEHALRNDAFCLQLGKIIHKQGQLALSMNGIPPYFLELFDDPVIKAIDNSKLAINRTELGANVLELLGGANKLIGVVLTVADSSLQIDTTEGSFHITKSAKIRSKCKLGSRKINLNDTSPKAVSPNFFQNLGLCIGLGTSTELFLEYAILQKLAVNFILNPISALYPKSIGNLIDTASIKALILRLNDQFGFMVTQVLGLQGDILYKGEILITDRLLLSATHIASTGQNVNARRRIEYINLRTFLDLILLIANKKKLFSVYSQLEITIRLFDLFKNIHDCLEIYAKNPASSIDKQLQSFAIDLYALAEDAEKIEIIQNPMLEHAITTRELLLQVSLSNQLVALAEANNHLLSLLCALDRYANLKTMIDRLPTSTHPEVLKNLKKIKNDLAHANVQVDNLLNQYPVFFKTRADKSMNRIKKNKKNTKSVKR